MTSTIALRYGLHRNQLYGWRRELRAAVVADGGIPLLDFVPIVAERRTDTAQSHQFPALEPQHCRNNAQYGQQQAKQDEGGRASQLIAHPSKVHAKKPSQKADRQKDQRDDGQAVDLIAWRRAIAVA